VRISGLNTVIRNLNREIKKIEGRSMKGLIEAQIIIRRDMDKTPPKIPVDTGNLRASYYTIISSGKLLEGETPNFKGGSAPRMSGEHMPEIMRAKNLLPSNGPSLALGFSAFYAWFVHEMIDAKFGRPGAGAKFLEASIKRNKKPILEAIRKSAKVRK